MVSEKTVLIYDGECSYCRRFAKTARWLDRGHQLDLLTYQSSPAQTILKAQFGNDAGFTMYLFNQTEVFWAQSAAREATRLLGLPRWIQWLGFRMYPKVVEVVTRLTGRQETVCMPNQGRCVRAQTDEGTMRLTPEANRQLTSFQS